MAGKEIAVKKYVVRLDAEERDQLNELIRKGKRSAQLLTKARILVTAQVGWMTQARRRDLAKCDGWWVRASMMFQPCFLAVEKKERMRAKSIAPSDERKPPEIF